MRISGICVVLTLLGSLLLSACAAQTSMPYQTTPVMETPVSAYPPPDAAYPGPTVSEPTPTPLGRTIDGRSQNIFQSYQVAVDWAKQKFAPDAQLYEVVPSRAMLSNIGNPPTALGWFFKFRSKNQPGRDIFVQVVDGDFAASHEKSLMGDLPKEELPIDIANLPFDDTKVMEIFKEYASAKGIQLQADSYDLELISLQGTAGPVWGVISPIDNTVIVWIDAVSGDERSDPNL